MKRYELVKENLGYCPGNRGRKTAIEEVEVADLDEYIKNLHSEKSYKYEKEEMPGGVVIYHLDVAGVVERYTFTEIPD